MDSGSNSHGCESDEGSREGRAFVKFPRTVHLLNLGAASRDDMVFDVRDAESWIKHDIIAEEKVDGGNLGVSFDEQWRCVTQKRGHFVSCHSEPQFSKLQSWLDRHHATLARVLGQQYILFGEWLAAKHTIHYDKLPDLFLAFDIYDRDENKFVSTDVRNQMLQDTGIYCVRTVACRRFGSVEDIVELMNAQDSAYIQRPTPIEGLYLRQEEGGFTTARSKIVSKGFIQGLQGMGKFWAHQGIIPNGVRPDLWLDYE